ncbi:hypothetical protein EDC04DRAFT_2910467 [Pisolithus marmoratus]|nr:hypothetical protein EDC04DRAFT_2910467 [Pisolithus marmoratus]
MASYKSSLSNIESSLAIAEYQQSPSVQPTASSKVVGLLSHAELALYMLRCGTLESQSLCDLFVAAIDQHTNEMAKHWWITKENQHMQRQFNNCLYDLLQETEYHQVGGFKELSEEITSKESSDEETDDNAEGEVEERPESDPEV